VFNLMTDAGVLVEDRLFATLDSTVRRLELVDGHHGLMSDTVGFVRRLPHELVEAFKSTLDEVKEADLLLHVVDAADESPDRQIESVRQVLREIGAGDLPELLVINKIDVADTTAVERLRRLHPGSVAVSAVTGEGRDQLVAAMMTALEESTAEVELLVPYSDGEVLAAIHAAGHVIMQEHVETGTHVKARLPRTELARFAAFKY
jgi:GTP-binding protein HflX